MNSSSEMRDYYEHSENFMENVLIIDHVLENKLFISRITGVLSFMDQGK